MYVTMEIAQCNTHIGRNDLKLSLGFIGFIKHHTMKIYVEGRYCCTGWRHVNFTPEHFISGGRYCTDFWLESPKEHVDGVEKTYV